VAKASPGAQLINHRDTILQAIARAQRPQTPLPELVLPVWTMDLLTSFTAKAKASAAHVYGISCAADAPAQVADILRSNGAPLQLHIPASSPLNQLPWNTITELAISASPPSGNQSALSAADYGIAETGTLVFFSGPWSHSSWHFRPGREFILIEKSCILPRLEDVICRLEAGGAMPATVNLVTGPSRTADIEQTIEMGAHGPREVHILITG
jgi:L-lactate dehydrogenase complex protein LldG